MKEYIGDGVYAEDDGYNLILTTETGLETTNKIILEPYVLGQLLEFAMKGNSYLTFTIKRATPPPS